MIPVGTLCVIVPPACRGVGEFVTVVGVLRDVPITDCDGNAKIYPVAYDIDGGNVPRTLAQVLARSGANVAEPEVLHIIRPPRSASPVTTTRDEPVTA